MLHKALDGFATAIRWAVVLLTCVMLLALTLQIGARFLLGVALSWTEELALGCFSWSMLLALSLGVRGAIHARMDLLVDRLPAGLARAVTALVHLAMAALGVFIAWAGVRYVADSWGTTSAAIGYPIAWLYAAAPACGITLVVFALERAVLGAPPPAEAIGA
jgi:TRAP-type C4-dicarboxylate transport system permease small subunit